MGVAFQLIDDVIDISSNASGKTPGTDLRAGVPTMPTLILRQVAETDATARELVEIIDSGLEDDAVLADVVARLRKHEALAQALQVAKNWSEQAIAALEPLPDSTVKSALQVFAQAVVERDE